MTDDQFTIEARDGNPAGLVVDPTNNTFTIEKGTTSEKHIILAKEKGVSNAPVKEIEVRRLINPLIYVTEYNVLLMPRASSPPMQPLLAVTLTLIPLLEI